MSPLPLIWRRWRLDLHPLTGEPETRLTDRARLLLPLLRFGQLFLAVDYSLGCLLTGGRQITTVSAQIGAARLGLYGAVWRRAAWPPEVAINLVASALNTVGAVYRWAILRERWKGPLEQWPHCADAWRWEQAHRPRTDI